MKKLLEIAVFSPEAALIADQAKADRIELCSGYAEGGLTPSAATIRFVRENVKCPVFVMIRPRGGDFCYSKTELEIMKRDIEYCNEIGVDGIVFGALDKHFSIDKTATSQLVSSSNSLPVTFHRAFDLCHNPSEAMEILIDCGIKRILTSGQKSSAIEGVELIAELNAKANERIIIMPGAGINPGNISDLVRYTNCKEFHASAKRISTHSDSFGFGEHVLPHPEIIAELKKKLHL